MKTDKLLIIVRHGAASTNANNAGITEIGCAQMDDLCDVIDTVVNDIYGEKTPPKRLLFSFSKLPRAIQSIGKLAHPSLYEDIILTDLYLTERKDIREPKKIVEKVLGLSEYYEALVAVIVAHGEMPAVIAETAHEMVTGEKSEEFPYTQNAHGFVINMTTGATLKIHPNFLEEYEARKKVDAAAGNIVASLAPWACVL